MGSLVPFDPLSSSFLCGIPYNFLARTQGHGSLSVTADSEEVGAEASRMLDDDHATAWVSADLGGGSVKIEFDFGEPKLCDTLVIAANNWQPADGIEIDLWAGLIDVGAAAVESGPGLDSVVRPDSDFITEDQELRLENSLNHSPFRFTPTVIRSGRITIDTTSGNGPDSILEAAFLYAGLNLDVGKVLGPNTLTFEPLSPTTRSIGGGGSWTPRFPYRRNDFPLSFLLALNSAAVNAWTGGPKRGLKTFFWPKTLDLDSFSSSAYFGGIPASSKSPRIAPGVGTLTSTEIVELR